MDKLDKLLIIMSMMALFFIGLVIGMYSPAIGNNEPMVADYIKQHNRGCDNLTRYEDGTMVCEVFFRENIEEDEVNVIVMTEQAI